MSSKLIYRPDIDGLRAIAVLAVIAGHLPEKLLPSGYLGVDVFFVISGFVVSASLFNQKHTKLIELYSYFLARRVKRLLPALTVCALVTILVVLAVDPFPRNSIQTGVASLFGVSNFVLFNFELDYFSPSSRFNAFTHTWSLGVEEQFYIIYPMFGWLVYFRLKNKISKPLLAALLTVSILSLISFIWLYDTHQEAVYYMMPTRIWEFGLGALTFLSSRHQRMPSWLGKTMRKLSSFALLILIFCFFMPMDWAVEATILAVAMACLMLSNENNWASLRLLTISPIVYIGKISYSLYLWHWPVIVLGPMVLTTSWRSSVLYSVVIGIAALVSYHFVEKPLRSRRWTSSNARDIGVGFITSILLTSAALLFGTKMNSETAALYPPSFLPVIPSGLPYSPTCVVDGKGRKLMADTVDKCTVAPRVGSGMPTIWGMGDSHAGHLQGLLYELHNRLGVGIHLIETHGSHFPSHENTGLPQREMIFESNKKKMKPGDIVLVSRLYLFRAAPPIPVALGPWLQGASDLADDLALQGVSLVITGPPPIFQFEDIRSCSLDNHDSCRIDRASIAPIMGTVVDQLTQLEKSHNNIHIFDIFNNVCPPDMEYCYPDDGSSFLFRDKDHFNSLGSARLAEPFVGLLRSAGLMTSQ